MLDLRLVSENLDLVREQLARRGFTDSEALDRLGKLTEERRKVITEAESLRQQRNSASSEMGKIKDKKSDEFQQKRAALRELGDQLKQLEERLQ